MGPYLVIAGIGLLVLAGATALVFFIARGSERPRRTAWLCAGLLVMAFIGFVVLNVAATNYTMTTGWIIGLAIAPIVVIGLAVLIGSDVKWRVSRLVALAGLVLLGGMIVVVLAMLGVGSNLVQPLYVNRAAQIAEANGFTAVLPPDEDMRTDYLPVEPLPEPDEGFSASYEKFGLQERKGTGASEADLEELVAPGATPMGEGSQPIPSGGTITKTTVQGQPAVANEYTVGMGGEELAKDKPATGKTSTIIVLVFELDGVDVRMSSESGATDSGGEWVPFSNLSVDDLVAIAETFEPVE